MRTLGSTYRAAALQSPWWGGWESWRFVRSAESVPWRWHLWTDGISVVSALVSRGVWREGPDISYTDTQRPGKIGEILKTILTEGIGDFRPASLGLVFHTADDLAFVAVRKQFETPDAFETAPLLARDDPGYLVEERVDPGAGYRFVPLAAARSAVAAKLSMHREAIFADWLSPTSRVRVSLRSAVLDILDGLAAQAAGDVDDACWLVVFPRMTVLCLHRARVGLVGVSSLPHGSRGCPPDLGFRTASLLKSCDRENPVVRVFAGSPEVRTETTEEALRTVGGFGGRIHTYTFSEWRSKLSKKGAEPPRPEFETEACGNRGPGISGNFSAAALRADDLRIRRSDARLLAGARVVRSTAFLGGIAAIAWLAATVAATVTTDSWRLPESAFEAKVAEADSLRALRKGAMAAERLFAPRSTAWTTLELLSILFPENEGMLLRTVSYSAAPQGSAASAATASGWSRTWKIEGIADPGGSAAVDGLGRQRLATAFEKVADLPGSGMFEAKGKREVESTIHREPAQTEKVGTRLYGSRFALEVRQTFPPTDALAIPGAAVDWPPLAQVSAYLP